MNTSGEFEVIIKPMDAYAKGSGGTKLGRMSINKKFSGGLTATSKGEMLSAMTAVQGSAGYVAIEQIKGELAGKEGGFVLQHFGVMDNGEDRLILQVVPDSGTGQLTGLSGEMSIEIEDGKHYYKFDYELAQ